MDQQQWPDVILDGSNPSKAWNRIFDALCKIAQESTSPYKLHEATVAPDRILAEAAWELWASYSSNATRNSEELRSWCSGSSAGGRAVLILDAFSLRELHLLLSGAKTRGIEPTLVKVTGSEIPSDTNTFSQALGLSSRSQLSYNGKPAGFRLFDSGVYTDVLSHPSGDCVSRISNDCNVLIWHTWLDDLIHVHKRLPDQIYSAAAVELQGDGFWNFVNRLRQGRKLVITSDHGYADGKLFSSEEMDSHVIDTLRDAFGASRYREASGTWPNKFMPPLVHCENGHYVVMGQRKWKVQGGFPNLLHGGMSLLEVAVPFIELPAL